MVLQKGKKKGLFMTPNIDVVILHFIICGCCVKGVIDVVSWVLLAMQFIVWYLKVFWGMHYWDMDPCAFHGKRLVKKICDFWWDGDLCIPNFVAIHVANISNSAKINRSNHHNITNKQIFSSCLLKWVKI